MERELNMVVALQELQKKLDRHEVRLLDLEKRCLQGSAMEESLTDSSQELDYKEPILKKADERVLREVATLRLRNNKRRRYICAALIICVGSLLVGICWVAIV